MSRIEKQSKKMADVQKLFSSIEKSCMNIYNKSSKLNLRETGDIVNLISKTCDIDIEQARAIANMSLEFILADPNTFMEQKDKFDFTESNNYKSSQFIWEIWNGDAYGSKELIALQEFLDEINENINVISDTDLFVKKCQTDYINMLKN